MVFPKGRIKIVISSKKHEIHTFFGENKIR